MARKSRNDRLDTRTARLTLKPRREPYWHAIQDGRALGYRRLAGDKGGVWVAKWRDPDAAKPRQQRALGSADDFSDALDDGTLTFAQAQDEARHWFAELGRSGGRAAVPVTVAEAVADYLHEYRARGGKAVPETQRTLNAHILPKLGARKLGELTTAEIRGWHRRLATDAPRVRRKAGATKIATRAATDDPDEQRARRATANRVLSTLKAILNLAFREGRVASDEAWRRVQPFKSADAPVVRFLTDAEAKRLVNACAPDFRRLVTAALLTGCRYGELCALRPGDVNAEAHTLTIRTSKGGKPRHVVLTDEAAQFFAELCHGKARSDALLVRDDGEAWGASWQTRPMKLACKAASISPVVSFHILRHTHASRLAGQGVPMAVIAAQLGHADLKMTTKHYAHLAPSYVSETIRAAFGNLGLLPTSNIKSIGSVGSL